MDITKSTKLALTYIEGHMDDAIMLSEYTSRRNHIKSAKEHLQHLLEDIVNKSGNLVIDFNRETNNK